jgi:phosphoglycolate phosphatase
VGETPDLFPGGMMSPQLLIFDLDGTLIDSRADLAAAVNHMRGQFDLNALSRDTVVGYIGNGVRRLVAGSLQEADVDFEEALHIFKDYYKTHLTVHTTLYEGVEAGLRTLSNAGHALAVLTNKPGGPSRTILEYFNIENLFNVVIGGGDVEGLKPEPVGVIQCLDTTGYSSDAAWMVGDHYTDLAVAENAGIRSAFVRYGFGEERDYEPDVYFASFSELVGYFV